jgi:hypothetical protein
MRALVPSVGECHGGSCIHAAVAAFDQGGPSAVWFAAVQWVAAGVAPALLPHRLDIAQSLREVLGLDRGVWASGLAPGEDGIRPGSVRRLRMRRSSRETDLNED